MKSQFLKFSNLDLAQFLRFMPNFLHVSSKSKYLQLMYSNMGPKTTPSLIFRGGIRAWRVWEILIFSNNQANSKIKLIIFACHFRPPLEIKEGVVLGPLLLYISWKYLEIELTCKKLAKNLKNWARFLDFKFWEIEITSHLDSHKLP